MKPKDLLPKGINPKNIVPKNLIPKDLNPKEILPKVMESVSAAAEVATNAFDNTANVHITELDDMGNHIGDFAVKYLSGKLKPLTPDETVPRLAKIVYIGPDRTWSEAPITDAENNTVTFRTVSDYHTLECTLTFRDIINFSLSGSISEGRPEIIFQTLNDFALKIEFKEEKNTQGIERYFFREFNWFREENSDLGMYYGDVYFDTPSTERNPKLMMTALNLELAASTEAEGSQTRSRSIKLLLRDIGCEHVYVNDVYDSDPTIETTDVAIGSKRLDDCTLIFLVLSGAHYTVEFAANVMIGKVGEHTGFALSRDQGLDALREFIEKYGIKGRTKILVTGYSRTAAGSNLLGKYLCDAIAEHAVKRRVGDIDLKQEDLYVFGFETPLCGCYEEDKGMIHPDDPRYDNIWYVTNPDDPVTYVPTDRYGFVRYGKRVILNPDHDPELNRRMLANIEAYYGRDAVPFYDLLRFTRVSNLRYMEDVNKGFVVKFFEALGTRQFYFDSVEKDFVNAVYVATTREQVLRDVVKELGGIKGCLTTLHTYSKDKVKFVEVLRPSVERSAQRYGYGQFSDNLVNSAYQIMDLVERYCDGSITRFLTDKHLQAMLLNANRVVKAHFPSISLAYLMLEDPDYAEPYVDTHPETENDSVF